MKYFSVQFKDGNGQESAWTLFAVRAIIGNLFLKLRVAFHTVLLLYYILHYFSHQVNNIF